MTSTPPKLWTIDELAAYLSIPTAEAWEAVRENGIPYLCYGKSLPDLTGKGRRRIRFSPDRVAAWVDASLKLYGEAKPIEAPAASVPALKEDMAGYAGSSIRPPKLRGPRKVVKA